MIKIYTDGACQPNPGRGGWAYVIINPSVYDLYANSGSVPVATNNQMEILAVIKALESVPSGEYEIISDSQYLVGTMINGWAMKKNKDLWGRLLRAVADKKIIWTKVEGHAGDRWNTFVDKEAQRAILRAVTREVIELNREALEKLG